MSREMTWVAVVAVSEAGDQRAIVETGLDGHRVRETGRVGSHRAAGRPAGAAAERAPAVDRSCGGRGRWWFLVFSLALLLLPGWRCGQSGREGGLEFVPLVCRSPHVKTQMERVHYPEDDCRAAVRKAEGRLASGHYRRACEQMSPAAGLPTKVVQVRATACAEAASLDGYEGGSVLWLDVCCP